MMVANKSVIKVRMVQCALRHLKEVAWAEDKLLQVNSKIMLFKTITIVWEKFPDGYFRVKIVCGKIFSSLGHPIKIFNNELLN